MSVEPRDPTVSPPDRGIIRVALEGAAGTVVITLGVGVLTAVLLAPPLIGIAVGGIIGGAIGLVIGMALFAGLMDGAWEWMARR